MGGGFGWGTYVSGSLYSHLGEPLMLDLSNSYAEMLNFDYETGTRRPKKAWLVREGMAGYDLDLEYGYDHAGNVRSIVDRPTGDPVDGQCFRYDGLRRLIEAWTPASATCGADPTTAGLGGPAPYWNSYTHDAIGNRETEVRHASGGDTTRTYTYPNPGQPRPHAVTQVAQTGAAGSATLSYTYDAAGNTTCRPSGTATNTCPAGTASQALTWDAEGQLATVTPTGGSASSFVYTANGDRLLRREGGVTTVYLPGGQELRLTVATGVKTAQRYYTFGGATVAMRTGTGLAGVTSLISDHHGTAEIAIHNTNRTLTQRRHDPYGNPRGTNPTWPGDHDFLGAPKDATGLTHLGAREYDPSIGRFISVDPLMDLADPQMWQGYSYANNSPVTLSDPTGTDPGGGQCADTKGCSVNPLWGTPNNGVGGKRLGSSNPNKGVTPNDLIAKGGCPHWDSCSNGYKHGVAFEKQTIPAQVELIRQTICANNKAMCDEMQRALHQAGMLVLQEVLAELSGYNDIKDCAGGNGLGCFWTVLGFMPQEKLRDLVRLGNIGEGIAASARVVEAGRIIDDSPWGAASCLISYNSFSGDTKVLMADGTTKPIKDIKPGDLVFATDPVTGVEGAREVTHVWVHQDQLVDLKLEGGRRITTTEDHPFWNDTDRAWQDADDIGAGDQLRSLDPAIRVAAVGLDRLSLRAGQAHNLTVDDIHTYYVLADTTPVLVHNDPHACGWQLRNAKGQIKNSGDMSSGSSTGGSLDWNEQLATHTERKILEGLRDQVSPGDVITMQGDLNPCNPGLRGCESFMAQFAQEYGVKIIYKQLGFDTPWVFDGT
jgi:RHS repeat-associated protein